MLEVSFLEKPALAMNIDDFVNGLNIARLSRQEIAQALIEKGIEGEITDATVRCLKSATFNSVGTLTIEGLMDIFQDLKNAGLSRHATIRGYMICAAKTIKNSHVNDGLTA